MNEETLKELFVEQIRDVYDAEKQIVKALPKIARAAQSEDLADALRSHLEETENHVVRLEKIFGVLDENARGKPCKGMKGLLEEGNEAIQKQDKGALRDLALIAGCQRVEHYEIAAYGTLRTLAEHLALTDAVSLLQETEDEEKRADDKLTELATSLYKASGEADEGEQSEQAGPVEARSASRASSERSPAKRKAS